MLNAIIEFFKLFIKELFSVPKSSPESEKEDEIEIPFPGQSPVKFHLGIIVGHTKKDGGAVLVGSKEYPNEYAYNTKIANNLINLSKDHTWLKLTVIYRDGIGISGAYAKATKENCDGVIELHFNAAANTLAKGTETLVSSSVDDRAFGVFVQKEVCEAFDRVGMSRGVKAISRSDRGASNVYGFPTGVNCLVEPFFGSNEQEAKLALANMEKYSIALIEAVKRWAIYKGFTNDKVVDAHENI